MKTNQFKNACIYPVTLFMSLGLNVKIRVYLEPFLAVPFAMFQAYHTLFESLTHNADMIH